MTKSLVIAATLATLTATAAAESYDATQPATPNTHYVMGGASVGIGRAIQGGLQLEAGKALASNPHLFIRGQLTHGASGSDGTFSQARVGVEGRGCVLREWFCGTAGIDAGYQHDLSADGAWWFGDDVAGGGIYHVDSHDVLIVPRLGVEAGKTIKLRAAVELPFYRSVVATDQMHTADGGMGLTALVGAGYAF